MNKNLAINGVAVAVGLMFSLTAGAVKHEIKTMKEILTLAFSAILIQKVLLSRFLGTCPFMGVSNKRSSAVGMGLAVVFVITLSSVISWALYNYVLVVFEMTYMKTIIFILVIAALVQIIEMFVKKVSPPLYWCVMQRKWPMAAKILN